MQELGHRGGQDQLLAAFMGSHGIKMTKKVLLVTTFNDEKFIAISSTGGIVFISCKCILFQDA